MSVNKKIVATMCIIMSATSITACGVKSGTASSEEAPYYTVSIDGDHIAIDEKNEDIIALKEAGATFVEQEVPKDYKNPVADTEFASYTKEMAEQYKESDQASSSLAMIETYELQINLDQTEVKEIEVYKRHGQKAANVTCEYISTITHASDLYLKMTQTKTDTKYSRLMKITYLYEDGQWKVYAYDYTQRVEVQ